MIDAFEQSMIDFVEAKYNQEFGSTRNPDRNAVEVLMDANFSDDAWQGDKRGFCDAICDAIADGHYYSITQAAA